MSDNIQYQIYWIQVKYCVFQAELQAGRLYWRINVKLYWLSVHKKGLQLSTVVFCKGTKRIISFHLGLSCFGIERYIRDKRALKLMSRLYTKNKAKNFRFLVLYKFYDIFKKKKNYI